MVLLSGFKKGVLWELQKLIEKLNSTDLSDKEIDKYNKFLSK